MRAFAGPSMQVCDGLAPLAPRSYMAVNFNHHSSVCSGSSSPASHSLEWRWGRDALTGQASQAEAISLVPGSAKGTVQSLQALCWPTGRRIRLTMAVESFSRNSGRKIIVAKHAVIGCADVAPGLPARLD